MRLVAPYAVLLTLCTSVSAFSQSATPVEGSSTNSVSSANTPASVVDLSGFREEIARKNRALEDQVNAEKIIVKKNSVILQDARKIDAANKKLQAARKLLDAQNAEFLKEREAMQADQTDVPAPPLNRPAPVTPAHTQSPPPLPAPVITAAQSLPPVEQPVQLQTARTSEASKPLPTRPLSPDPRAQTASASSAPAIAPRQSPPPVQQAEKTIAPRPIDATPIPSASTGLKTASISPGPLASAPMAAAGGPTLAIVPKPAGPLRISAGVSQGMLLTPIRPVYPQIALSAHVDGSVVMEAVISKTGTVQSVHAISGPTLLRDAAIQAVKAARYEPYKLDQDAIEVQTTITIAFQRAY